MENESVPAPIPPILLNNLSGNSLSKKESVILNQDPTTDKKIANVSSSTIFKRISKPFLYVFLSISMVGLFGLIWGIIWAIGDLFSEKKFAAFLQAPLQAKFFWIGLVVIGWGFVIIFLFLFYHKEKPILIAKINESVEIYNSMVNDFN